MSTYVSLYRKYRPQSFTDVVGQDHITRILQNALESGRVAHAYLFCGPRGTGKTTTARLLAKALNCANGPARDPCNNCESCRRITAGTALDVIEIDAASNRGIDDIRELREKVKYAPAEARHKVYVIDECHMLTTEAFNALLKTLEEPPAHVLFILATTDPQKVPATILSRCQRLDFRRGSVADLVKRLQVVAAGEGLDAETDALTLVARAADGSWRDALSILEQIVAFGAQRVSAADVRAILGTVSTEMIYRCAEAIAGNDAAGALRLVAQLADEGKDIRDFLRGLVAHFRNLLLVGAAGGAILPDGATAEESRVLTEQARHFAPQVCLRAIEALSEAEREMRHDSQQRLLLEIAILRLAHAPAQAAAMPARAVAPPEQAYAPSRVAAPPTREISAPAPSAPAAPRHEAPVAHASALPQRETASVEPAAATSTMPATPPPPAPTPRPAAGSGRTVTVDDVRAQWPIIIERVGKPMLRGVMRDVRPAWIHNNELLLLVKQGYSFHLEQLEKNENIRLVQDTIRQILDPNLSVRVEMDNGQQEPPPAQSAAPPSAGARSGDSGPAPEAPAAPRQEPNPYDQNTMSVKDVMDLFGGKIIQSNDER